MSFEEFSYFFGNGCENCYGLGFWYVEVEFGEVVVEDDEIRVC